jgi:hypothetical protein
VCASACACVRATERECVYVCVYACVCMCICACVYTYIYTHVQVANEKFVTTHYMTSDKTFVKFREEGKEATVAWLGLSVLVISLQWVDKTRGVTTNSMCVSRRRGVPTCGPTWSGTERAIRWPRARKVRCLLPRMWLGLRRRGRLQRYTCRQTLIAPRGLKLWRTCCPRSCPARAKALRIPGVMGRYRRSTPMSLTALRPSTKGLPL